MNRDDVNLSILGKHVHQACCKCARKETKLTSNMSHPCEIAAELPVDRV